MCVGQEIAPIPIEGQVGENVTITCRARFAGESINNVLQIVRPSGVVESYEEAPEVMGRLFRVTDVDDLTTYSLGPLMQSDNGTVLLCTVDSMNSNRSTIFVTCRYFLFSLSLSRSVFLSLHWGILKKC